MSADNDPSNQSPDLRRDPVYFQFYRTPEAGDIARGRTNQLAFTPIHHPYFMTTPSRKVSRNKELQRPSKNTEANKKLINLSKMVFEHIQRYPETSGNTITEELQRYFRDQGEEADFKNIQRRVYDALNVMEALGLVLKERNRIQYLDSKVYQGKERKQKQQEHERRKKRQENQRYLLMRYREMEIIKTKTKIFQLKVDAMKQIAGRNFKRRDRVQPLINLPFICIASSHPLPVLKNEEGSALCIQVPNNTKVKIESELAFINRLNIRQSLRNPTQKRLVARKQFKINEQINPELIDPLVSEPLAPVASVREVSINLLGEQQAQQKMLAFSPYPGHPQCSLGTPSPGLIQQRVLQKIHGISEEQKKEREYLKKRKLFMNDFFGTKQLKDSKGKKYKQEYRVKRILKEEYHPRESEIDLDNLVHINPAHAMLQSPAMSRIAQEFHNKYSVKEVKEMTRLKINKSGSELSSFKKTFDKMNKKQINLK